jgi:ubiquinone biosynthesis protein COQ4
MKREKKRRRPLDEEAAAEIVNSGDALARYWLALRAGTRLALDTSDTKQVFVLAAAVDRPTLKALYQRMLERPAGRALLEERPAIDSRSIDYTALRALPANTLGGAYARMLDAKKLDPDVFQAPPQLAPELAYVAQRLRQSHDLWHVLTGLPTDVPGEIALQAFTYAQIRGTTSWLLMVFGVLIFGLRYPQLLTEVRAWYRAGERCAFLPEVRWEDRWQEPLELVRTSLGIVPSTRAQTSSPSTPPAATTS